MPELPEVETIVRSLRNGKAGPGLIGQSIRRVRTTWPRHIEHPSPATFKRKIRDRTIMDVSRRGKYLVFLLDEGSLLIHLRMSGDLHMSPTACELGPYEHTWFELKNGWDLRFSDARKFGRIGWYREPGVVLDRLGPEPLDPSFTPRVLQQRLETRSRQLKPLLLDQFFIAGLGNIYVDEALHRANVHPLRLSNSLDQGETEALWRGIRDALYDGIDHNGASIDWVYRGGEFQNHFRVYQRAGENCDVCGTPIQRIIVGQRGTHFCPTCQLEKVQ
ncbi:MAG: DNA-formamidopyrimidine glycosylase [Anaerolineales bacterium]|nr:MAG: DNA-formamidopyrimidine glycosylase [Anaerolineales bacterium]